jgi:hypothetical protein
MFNWLRVLSGSKTYKKYLAADLKLREHLPFWIAFIKIFKLMHGIKTTDSTITHLGLGEILFEFKTIQYGAFMPLSSLLYTLTKDRDFHINLYQMNEYVRIMIQHECTIEGYEI